MAQLEGTYKTLKPRKLSPPVEHAKKLIEQEKSKLPNNKILRFFKLFFGEGL